MIMPESLRQSPTDHPEISCLFLMDDDFSCQGTDGDYDDDILSSANVY